MSAFIVNTYHIDRLVATALYGPKDKRAPWHARYYVDGNPSATGQMLHDANVRSVNYRYQDSEQPEPYTFSHTTPPMPSVEALKAIACYRYQSCEVPDWQGSEAEEWSDRLHHAIVSALPGYDDAPWEQTPERATV